MPLNESLSPVQLRVKYNTGVARHTQKIYFQTGTTAIWNDALFLDQWVIQVPVSGTKLSVSGIVGEIYTRVKSVLPVGTVLEQIELWAGAPGPNTFIGFQTPPTGLPAFTGTKVASSYWMWVFSDDNRNLFRIQWFDGVESRPQRQPFIPPPQIDDGTAVWYFLKSGVPFATNDGHRITRGLSENIGYNRSLARRYGRQISP